jgi:hypothetical protein
MTMTKSESATLKRKEREDKSAVRALMEES